MENSRQKVNHQARVLKTQLGRPSRSELLLLFAFVQPRAIEGFASYLLHGTCVLMQDTQICWQPTNLLPLDACVAIGDGKLVPVIKTIRTDHYIIVFELALL